MNSKEAQAKAEALLKQAEPRNFNGYLQLAEAWRKMAEELHWRENSIPLAAPLAKIEEVARDV